MINIDSKIEFQVKRIIALIAYANNDIDEEERQLLTSSITGSPGISEEQVATLLEDARKKPSIEKLVSEISGGDAIRYLLFNVIALLTLKHELSREEIAKIYAVIAAIALPEKTVSLMKNVACTLLEVKQHLESKTG